MLIAMIIIQRVVVAKGKFIVEIVMDL